MEPDAAGSRRWPRGSWSPGGLGGVVAWVRARGRGPAGGAGRPAAPGTSRTGRTGAGGRGGAGAARTIFAHRAVVLGVTGRSCWRGWRRWRRASRLPAWCRGCGGWRGLRVGWCSCSPGRGPVGGDGRGAAGVVAGVRGAGRGVRAGAGAVCWTGGSSEVLRGRGGGAVLDRVDVVQPALFAVMVALAAVWRWLGWSRRRWRVIRRGRSRRRTWPGCCRWRTRAGGGGCAGRALARPGRDRGDGFGRGPAGSRRRCWRAGGRGCR